MNNENYDNINLDEFVVDTKTHEVFDEEEAKLVSEGVSAESVDKKHEESPFEKIKNASVQYGLDIQDPKDNCKRCHGKGYIGMRVDPATNKSSGIPVACPCIYPKVSSTFEQKQRDSAQDIMQAKHTNRKQRRQYERALRKKR